MHQDRAITAFLAIFLADFFARTAYMAAKSPALPVFADQLGASEVLLGMILAVSTLTGIVLKPLFGLLSDRIGRWIWLAIGTAIFAATPVLYLGVKSTETLLLLRLFHGLATAIYGPVTLAYVAELNSKPRAELFGWFGLSRTAGYVLGPLIGGAMLLWVSPATLLAGTSGIAVVAFLPVLFLSRLETGAGVVAKAGVEVSLGSLLRTVLRNRPLLAFGLVELVSRIGIYAVKAFIPLIILRNGGSVLEAGVFLSVQELAVAITRPIAGRAADRFDTPTGVAIAGLVVVALALAFLPVATSAGWLGLSAALIGVGNGMYHPAALALIAMSTDEDARGFSFGVVGAFRNVGKLLGPVLGGVLLYAYPPDVAFAVLGLVTGLAILPFLRGHRVRVRAV